ncbi:MAG: response regulator [Bdellovibrio sp.]|nr:response regulator [Bdellovibrio sp.]
MVTSVEPGVHIEMRAHKEKNTILIVDDNVDHLRLHKILLEMADYEVFTAQSGNEALSFLSKNDAPDLILLDMRMEDMSGPEFLRQLEEKLPKILQMVPVVFLTAMDQVPESKAVGFIRKPTEMDKFLEAVNRFIETGVGHTPK